MAEGIAYYIPPEFRRMGKSAMDLLSAIDPAQGIMRGMAASGRAFDTELPADERKAAAIEAGVETLFPVGMIGMGAAAKQPAKAVLMDILTPTGATKDIAEDTLADPSRRKFLQGAAAAVPVAAVAPDVITDVVTKATKAGGRAAINPLDMAMQNIRILRGQIDEQYGIVNEVLDNPRSSGMLPDEKVALDDANAMIARTEQEVIDEAYEAMINMDPAEFSQAIRGASDEALEEIVSVQYDSIIGNQRLADDGPNITAMAQEMQRRGMHTAKDRNGVSRFPNAETFVMDVTEPIVDSGVDQGLIIEKMGVDYPAGLNMTRQTPPDIQEDITQLKLTELRRQIEQADRVMRIEGKSTKEIDDFKAQKRREMFELQNLPPDMDDFYAQGGAVEGVGSLSRVARDMFRGPRGIATLSRFAEGGPADRKYTGFDDDREALEALANVEYAADMQKYLDPIARLGFDPDVVKTTTGSTMYPEDAYRKPSDTLTVDTNFGAYAPEVQAHEFRHRGMYDILNLYISDPKRFEAEFGTPAAVYAQNILKDMRGPQNQVYSESLAEFFEQPSQFNYPRVYYSETGEVIQSGDIDAYREANPGVDTMAVNRQQDGHLTQFLDRNTQPLVEGYREFKETGVIPEVGDVSSDKLRQMYEGAEGMQSAAEFLLERNPVRGYSQGGAAIATEDELSNMRTKVMNDYGFDPVSVAIEEGVDPELLLRVMYTENKGRQGPRSEKGAIGLMQLMPGTAEELGVDPYDPEDNTRGGARYLAQMLARFESIPLALAAYNAGPGNVTDYGGIPPFAETQNYVRQIAPALTGADIERQIEDTSEAFVMSQPVAAEGEYSPVPMLRPFNLPTYTGSPGTSPIPQLRPQEPEETPQSIPSVAGVIPGRRTNLYEQYGGIASLTNP